MYSQPNVILRFSDFGGVFFSLHSHWLVVRRHQLMAFQLSKRRLLFFFSLPLIFGVNLNLQPMFSFYAVGAFYASVMLLLMMMLMKLA